MRMHRIHATSLARRGWTSSGQSAQVNLEDSPAPAGIFLLASYLADVHYRPMQGAITTFWGKLDNEEGQARSWHPLLHHCADVAACAEALLANTLLGARMAAWGNLEGLNAEHIARLSVLAALHDIGKYNGGFQAKSGDCAKVARCGHVREVLALFGENFSEQTDRLVEVLPISEFELWSLDPCSTFELLVAAIGHHGRPYTCSRPDNFNASGIWTSKDIDDPFAGIAELVAATRRWFPAAFEPGGLPLPNEATFAHGFSGLVMLADWLGSHRDFFPFSSTLAHDHMPRARTQAQAALLAVGLDVRPARSALGPSRPTFSTISPFPSPQPVQSATGDLPLKAGGSLTILEAETGSGKTEAALLRYIQLFQAGLVDGLYFALPTRTAATQIHRRVVDAVARAFPGQVERPPVLLAVPGYLRVDGSDGRRLPGFKVLWNDDPHQRMRFRGWAAENSKRYLAGAVVIGTIDQVLMSTIMASHAHLRATSLSRLLLVVDEVHASDIYMNRLLKEVLRFHLQAKGHALLMSATLGADARSQLLSAVGAHSPAPPPEEASCLPYPMISHYQPERPVVQIAIGQSERTKTVQP
ncbi:MAG TPA: CRISPR-associated endonuclease Cas3'', partial [Nannocystis exedens]|nr:CRISPR-associated endonuclease Cas3'' [Nannocystis exedens]